MAPLAALAAAIPEALAAAGSAAATAAGTAASAVGGASGIGTALSLAGTAAGVAGAIQQGRAAKSEAKAAAAQEERKAAETTAVASREAEARRRDTARLISRQTALSAADGGGSINPTVLDVIGDTAQQGEYLASSELYNGRNAAAGMMDQANTLRTRGKNAATASYIDAAGSVLEGGYKLGKNRSWWN